MNILHKLCFFFNYSLLIWVVLKLQETPEYWRGIIRQHIDFEPTRTPVHHHQGYYKKLQDQVLSRFTASEYKFQKRKTLIMSKAKKMSVSCRKSSSLAVR